MVEAVRPLSEVIPGRINSLEQVVLLAQHFPPMTSDHKPAWMLKHGLAVEAYRRTHRKTRGIQGWDHGDADIMLITTDLEYRELMDWHNHGLDLSVFGYSLFGSAFNDLIIETVRTVPFLDTRLICMHPAMIIVTKFADHRDLRLKDKIDCGILYALMNESIETVKAWSSIVKRGINYLDNQSSYRVETRWNIFVQGMIGKIVQFWLP